MQHDDLEHSGIANLSTEEVSQSELLSPPQYAKSDLLFNFFSPGKLIQQYALVICFHCFYLDIGHKWLHQYCISDVAHKICWGKQLPSEAFAMLHEFDCLIVSRITKIVFAVMQGVKKIPEPLIDGKLSYSLRRCNCRSNNCAVCANLLRKCKNVYIFGLLSDLSERFNNL